MKTIMKNIMKNTETACAPTTQRWPDLVPPTFAGGTTR